MVFDFKYHITTLIAVFLALGLGILIGSAMIGDDGIVREQQHLIVQIENDLNALRSQNSQYRAKVTSLETMMAEQGKFVEQLFQDAITDKLAGLKGLLVVDPQVQDGKVLTQLLKAAGMDVTDFSTLPQQWQPADHTKGWDLCLVMTQNMPPGMEQLFKKEQIYRPGTKNLTVKQSQYQLVKSLWKLRAKLPQRIMEKNPTGVQDGQVQLQVK